jgi:DNA-directed RNA polymerase subunit RPC12/RpoP
MTSKCSFCKKDFEANIVLKDANNNTYCKDCASKRISKAELPAYKTRIGELTYAELLVYETKLELELRLREMQFLETEKPEIRARIKEINNDLQNIAVIKNLVKQVTTDDALNQAFFDKLQKQQGG